MTSLLLALLLATNTITPPPITCLWLPQIVARKDAKQTAANLVYPYAPPDYIVLTKVCADFIALQPIPPYSLGQYPDFSTAIAVFSAIPASKRPRLVEAPDGSYLILSLL